MLIIFTVSICTILGHHAIFKFFYFKTNANQSYATSIQPSNTHLWRHFLYKTNFGLWEAL